MSEHPARRWGTDVWVVAANVLFLASIAHHYGTTGAVFDRHRVSEPETVDCTVALFESGVLKTRKAH